VDITLAPFDITRPGFIGPSESRVVVGGRVRVERAEGGMRHHLADAFSSVALSFRGGATVSDSDLVLVEARLSGAELVDAVLIERHCPTSTSRTDVARFGELGVGLALRARSRVVAGIRAYFEAESFLEVETPAMVICPGLDTHLDAFAIAESGRFLITSPEYQMKRLLVGGVPRCFQLARCFRRGELGGRHNPEFTMLEWYRAFAGADAIMRDTEAIVVAALAGGAQALDLARPFQRLSVKDAFQRYGKIDEAEMLRLAHEDDERFFRVLIEDVEPALEALQAPVFLHDYPAKMASLARLSPSDPRYAERFELYAAGLELSNGFSELTDPAEQRERFERDQRDRAALGKPVYPIDERFLAGLEAGMPPAAGNALGLDRLVALALDRSSIGDVIAFPFEIS
jgi:lysyl-tRNA synthetase class 2